MRQATTHEARAGDRRRRRGGGGKTIALLLPETKTTRYEAQDRPEFEAKVKELCPDCKVIYANATQDSAQAADAGRGRDHQGRRRARAGRRRRQVGRGHRPAGQSAEHPGDRLRPADLRTQDIAYYVSFDNVRQGRIQAQTLVDKLGPSAKGKSIVMINGAPTDPSAGDYKKGAHQVFDKSGLKIAKEYDTSDWSPDKAQREMEQAITAVGKDGFVGVYSANDGMAGGAIAAMKGAGIEPATMPITGGDAEVAAIQRILTGEQSQTIYLGIKQAGRDVGRARGRRRAGRDRRRRGSSTPRSTTGKEQVASVLLTPVAVTKDNIEGHRDQGRVLRPEGDLHGQVRPGVLVSRSRVSAR